MALKLYFMKYFERKISQCILPFRNFEKFTRKHLCQSRLFNKVAGLRTVTLLKKRFWYRCFPVNFSKFLKTPSITEHFRWLLLKTPVKQLIYREELVDLQLYYSRTFSQEVFKHMCFKHFKARKYYYGRIRQTKI